MPVDQLAPVALGQPHVDAHNAERDLVNRLVAASVVPPDGTPPGNFPMVAPDGTITWIRDPTTMFETPTAIIKGGKNPDGTWVDETVNIDAAMARIRMSPWGGRIHFENSCQYTGNASHAKANNSLGLKGALVVDRLSNVHFTGAHPGVTLWMNNLSGGNGVTHGLYFVGAASNVGLKNLRVQWLSRPNARGLGDAVRFLGYPGDPADSTWGWAAWSLTPMGAVVTIPAGTTGATLSVSVNGAAVETTPSITTLTAIGLKTALEALPSVGSGNATVVQSGTVSTLYRVTLNVPSTTAVPVISVVSSTGGTATAVGGIGGYSTGPIDKPFVLDSGAQDAPGVGVIFMGCRDIISSNFTVNDTYADGHHQNACRGGTITGYRYTNSRQGHGQGDDSLPFVTYYDPLVPAKSPEGPFRQPGLTDWSNDGLVAVGYVIHGGRASGIRITGCKNVICGHGKISRKGVGIMINGTMANYTLNMMSALSVTLNVNDGQGNNYTTPSITDITTTGLQTALANLSYVGDNVDVAANGTGSFVITIDPSIGTALLTVTASSDGTAVLATTNNWTTCASQGILVSDTPVDFCNTGISVQTNTDMTGNPLFWQFDIRLKTIPITRSKTMPVNNTGNGGPNGVIYGVKMDDCSGDVDLSLGCIGSVLSVMGGHVRNYTQKNLNGATTSLSIQGQGGSSTSLSAQNTHKAVIENVMVDGGMFNLRNIRDVTIVGRVGSRNAANGGLSLTNIQDLRMIGYFESLFWNRNNNAAKSGDGVLINRVKNVHGPLRILLETDAQDQGSPFHSLDIGGGNTADPGLVDAHLDVEYRTTMDPAVHTSDDVAIQTTANAGDGLPNLREWSLRMRTIHKGGSGTPAWFQRDYGNTTRVLSGLIVREVPDSSIVLKPANGSDARDVTSGITYTRVGGVWVASSRYIPTAYRKTTGTLSPSATAATYGTPSTLFTPNSGAASILFTGAHATLASVSGETITVRIRATYNDGSVNTWTNTATGNGALAVPSASGIDSGYTDGQYIVSIDVAIQSSKAASTATATAVVAGYSF